MEGRCQRGSGGRTDRLTGLCEDTSSSLDPRLEMRTEEEGGR